MANRTFKVYGQAYAESGDVTATLTINGTQVFSGAVNDSTTVRVGQPETENHLFTFVLDENTTGALSYSLAVSGGELCLGPTRYNGVKTQILPEDSPFWQEVGPTSTLEQQQTYSNLIGEANLGTELYNKMQSGLAGPDDVPAVIEVINSGPRNFNTGDGDFVRFEDIRSSAQIDGQNLAWTDDESKRNWPVIDAGQTFTCTWEFDPDTYL